MKIWGRKMGGAAVVASRCQGPVIGKGWDVEEHKEVWREFIVPGE